MGMPLTVVGTARRAATIQNMTTLEIQVTDSAVQKFVRTVPNWTFSAPELQPIILEELMSVWVQRAINGAQVEQLSDGEELVERYCATHPKCQGATAFGDTPDEALEGFRGILYGWLEVGLELGESIPEV